MVLVTHDMSWVTEYCNRALLIEQGQVIMEGEPAAVVAVHEAHMAEARAPQDRGRRGGRRGPADRARPLGPDDAGRAPGRAVQRRRRTPPNSPITAPAASAPCQSSSVGVAMDLAGEDDADRAAAPEGHVARRPASRSRSARPATSRAKIVRAKPCVTRASRAIASAMPPISTRDPIALGESRCRPG